MNSTEYKTSHLSNYDINTKVLLFKYKNNVKTISQRIRNSHKNQIIENLKLFLNNRKKFYILLFFLFFSKNECSNDFITNNIEQKSVIIPYIFLEDNEYQDFQKKILEEKHECLEKFFSHDENKILGCILYEYFLLKKDKPIIFNIFYIFLSEKDNKKIDSIMEKNKIKELFKIVQLVFLNDKSIIYTSIGSRFITKILKQNNDYDDKKKLVEELVIKLKGENKITDFLEKSCIQCLIYEITKRVYEYYFKHESIREKWSLFVLNYFIAFSFHVKANKILQKILDYETKYINTNDSLILLILNKSFISNENFIYYSIHEYASYVVQNFLKILYNENVSKFYENKIRDFNKIIFYNFEKLSCHKIANFIVRAFLEYETKFINTNDSLIFQIFDKLIINNENFIYYSIHEYSSYVVQNFLKILYNEKLDIRYENKIRELNNLIYNNFEKLSFDKLGNFIVRAFLEYEMKFINTDDSLIFQIFDKSIINNENLVYYCKDKHASFIVKRLFNILYNKNISKHYGNKIHDFNKFIKNNESELSLNDNGIYLLNKLMKYNLRNINKDNPNIFK